MSIDVTNLIDNHPWMHEAECQSYPEVFFSFKKQDQEIAKRMCNDYCSVREECLEYALTFEGVGIFAGKTEQEMKTLKRARRRLKQMQREANV